MTVVKNPGDPIYKTTILELKEDLSLGSPGAQGEFAFGQELEEREHTYNYIRPHHSLDLLTPDKYYRRWKKNQKALVSRMD